LRDHRGSFLGCHYQGTFYSGDLGTFTTGGDSILSRETAGHGHSAIPWENAVVPAGNTVCG